MSVVRKATRRLRRWDWDSILEDPKNEHEEGVKNEEEEEEEEVNRNGAHAEEPNIAPTNTKTRNRGGKRKSRATEAAGEEGNQGEKPKRSRQRASTSGRNRQSGAKRSRPSGGRASKANNAVAALKEEEAKDSHDEHLSVPTPSRDAGPMSDDLETSRIGDETLDDIDKDLLGDASGDEDKRQRRSRQQENGQEAPSSPPASAPTVSQPPGAERSKVTASEGDGVRPGVSAADQGHAPPGEDTDDAEEELESSIYDKNGYAGSDSSGPDTEVERLHDDDHDETMVDC